MRQNVGDGLVDAVIALESMFAGTDKAELRFRIAAAVAWLLEPDDPKRRSSMYREVRDLYDARSKIVHGAAWTADQGQARERAFEIGRDCLKMLYVDFPHLLRDDQRSVKIILHTDGELSD
jgi:hypothetical protein